MPEKKYRCPNAACPLGTNGKAGGIFIGGMTAEAKHLLTGQPIESLEKGVDYGEGICTNCGLKAEEWSPAKAVAGAVAEAEAQHKARLAEIKKGVN